MEYSNSSNIGSPEVGDVAHKETSTSFNIDSLQVGDVVTARTPDALLHKPFYESLSGHASENKKIKSATHPHLILETHFENPHHKYVRTIAQSTSVDPLNVLPEARDLLLVPAHDIIKKAGFNSGYLIMVYVDFTDPIDVKRLNFSMRIPKAEAGVSDAHIETLKKQVAEVEKQGLYKLQADKGVGGKGVVGKGAGDKGAGDKGAGDKGASDKGAGDKGVPGGKA